MKIFFVSFLFFCFCFSFLFLNSYWLECVMIQQGLCLEDGKGFLTIWVSYGIRSHAGEGLGSPLAPDSRGFWLCSEAKTIDCTKHHWLIICHLARRIKWWLSDQLLLWYFLCISINGFEGQLCKCNLCVMVYSFVLCRKTLCSLYTTSIKVSCLFTDTLNTHVLFCHLLTCVCLSQFF